MDSVSRGIASWLDGVLALALYRAELRRIQRDGCQLCGSGPARDDIAGKGEPADKHDQPDLDYRVIFIYRQCHRIADNIRFEREYVVSYALGRIVPELEYDAAQHSGIRAEHHATHLADIRRLEMGFGHRQGVLAAALCEIHHDKATRIPEQPRLAK
jgi:hypothetical protein